MSRIDVLRMEGLLHPYARALYDARSVGVGATATLATMKAMLELAIQAGTIAGARGQIEQAINDIHRALELARAAQRAVGQLMDNPSITKALTELHMLPTPPGIPITQPR